MKENSNPLIKYFPAIVRLINQHPNIQMIDAPKGFPREKIYREQISAVSDIKIYDDILLSSHTGSGKTAVYLSATYPNIPSLIISPRKFLQKQISEYRDDIVVFGRSEYPCRFETNAADAPCRGKKEIFLINECPVKMFTTFNEITGKEERHPYPCPDCEYLCAIKAGLGAIRDGRTVITNFANYYPYLESAKVIIIDEADLFFASVSSARKMKHIDFQESTTKATIEKELAAAKKEYEIVSQTKAGNRNDSRVVSRRIDKAKNHYLGLKGLLDNADLCFQYTRFDRNKGKDAIYVEIRPDKLSLLKERMFPTTTKDGLSRKVIIVTATPGNFTAQKVISYSVFMRTAVFYSPVALMTTSNTNKHPEVFEQCASFIHDTHEGFKRLMKENGKKTVVHCGSLAYAKTMETYLGRANCDLHTTGKLMQIIEKFRTSEAEYLLVTAAEYGGDFDYCSHQYILKVPYASLDERLQCLQTEMGSKEFGDWYSLNALYRLVQESGRVGRGAGGTGMTFILDRKFAELYGRYRDRMPPAFNESIKRSETI